MFCVVLFPDVRSGELVAIKICLSTENEIAALEHEASALQLLRSSASRLVQPGEVHIRNPNKAQGPKGRIPSLIFYGPSGEQAICSKQKILSNH